MSNVVDALEKPHTAPPPSPQPKFLQRASREDGNRIDSRISLLPPSVFLGLSFSGRSEEPVSASSRIALKRQFLNIEL
jgi:hypothetical protein